jgi:DNA-directed RNA polymerases I, II, and III subunit RPABC3
VHRLTIQLDVNTEIYPMEMTYYKMVLASSVNADGSDMFDIIRYENEGSESGMGALIDKYEYVMHGKVFKYQLKNDDKLM